MSELAQRSTRQRAEIWAALDAADGFRTAQDLHAALRQSGSRVGLTTVYRALQALAEGGQVDVLRNSAGEATYRRCASDDHHHHLVCRGCGRTVEIEGPEVEEWAARVARGHGFSEVHHVVEMTGVCESCVGR